MELFRKAFDSKHSQLVEEIDVEHGLWTALTDRHVLTDRQIRDCQTEVRYC